MLSRVERVSCKQLASGTHELMATRENVGAEQKAHFEQEITAEFSEFIAWGHEEAIE